jgi:glycosyltransferase involved in cell wall biosynthesis
MGGAEKFVVLLCNELVRQGVDIHLFIPKQSPIVHLLDKAVQVHLLKSTMGRVNPLLHWELARHIRVLRPDIIHTHSAKATELVHRLHWFFRATHVATKHNARKGRIFNHVRHVIAVSQEGLESIHGTRATLIHNGIKPVKVSPTVPNSTFSLVAIGRLDPIKGFDKLIDACAGLSFPYSLKIIGEGTECDALEKQIKRLGLEESITLSGFCHDIPQLMHQADVVVMSSHSEGFSLVMIEALFYAKLFISSPVGGAKEILDKFFLVEHKNLCAKLEELYNNLGHCQKKFQSMAHSLRDELAIGHCAKAHCGMYFRLKDSNEYSA